MKATPNPFILKILRGGMRSGLLLETEPMLSEASGFAGHEIMFSSNETQGREFARAPVVRARSSIWMISR